MNVMPIISFAAGLLCLTLSACSSGPEQASWQLQSKASMERVVAAYFDGNTRVEAAEFARTRSEISSTGRIDLIARVELLRCAARVASLVFEPCEGFETLRQDAAPAERAYADYLLGIPPSDTRLLPAAQQDPSPDAQAPLSALVAAGVKLRAGHASPALIQQAADTASAQGWRRPLLAWLGVQAARAEQAGDATEAARLRRRIALISQQALKASR